MLLVAPAVALPALARNESRGAHQREDHLGLDDAWQLNQMVAMKDNELNIKTAKEMAAA
jgi:succinate dehydrogenase/fumarate reductase flavoprotein subunit